MANHPINLVLRFLLELAILFSLGYWGWTQHGGAERFLLAIGLPLLAAALWGIFRVPGDPGNAPIAVPGIVRLLLELALFAVAVWALYASGRQNWGLVFALVTLAHYTASYDRIVWLVRA